MNYLVIDEFLQPDQCKELIELSERKGYDEADISFKDGPKMNKDYRDNLRCLLTSEDLRLELERLLLPHVPKTKMFIHQGGKTEEKKFLRLSGNFRFYKYLPGQKFKKHRDGSLLEEGGVSLITVLIYLNTAEDGGETFICDRSLPDQPKIKALEGRCLMFDHTLFHTGEELLSGVKYVLRTDLIYEHY